MKGEETKREEERSNQIKREDRRKEQRRIKEMKGKRGVECKSERLLGRINSCS